VVQKHGDPHVEQTHLSAVLQQLVMVLLVLFERQTVVRRGFKMLSPQLDQWRLRSIRRIILIHIKVVFFMIQIVIEIKLITLLMLLAMGGTLDLAIFG
jgi:hypothetical protein